MTGPSRLVYKYYKVQAQLFSPKTVYKDHLNNGKGKL